MSPTFMANSSVISHANECSGTRGSFCSPGLHSERKRHEEGTSKTAAQSGDCVQPCPFRATAQGPGRLPYRISMRKRMGKKLPPRTHLHVSENP